MEGRTKKARIESIRAIWLRAVRHGKIHMRGSNPELRLKKCAPHDE